jgi:hypothetical protein
MRSLFGGARFVRRSCAALSSDAWCRRLVVKPSAGRVGSNQGIRWDLS